MTNSSPETVYLNTAACGLVLSDTLSDANRLYEALGSNSSSAAETWRMEEEGSVRQSIATMLNAPVSSIAIIPNFSWGINGIVQSLKGSERVLLYKYDYPSLLEPFKINRFPITWIDAADGFKIDIGAIEHAVKTKSVDIVALSHVQWNSGYKLDLQAIGELCKANNVLFFVDATQSMGAETIDLSQLHIDVFAASNYKWMNAGFGTGVMCIRQEFIERYTPVTGGHNSYKMIDGVWQYTPSVISYEPGHPNIYGLTVLKAAIQHKMERGIAPIQQHNARLTSLLLDYIRDMPLQMVGDATVHNRAAIVILKDENGLGAWIKQHNITVTQRNGLLRISMHYYNTEQEIILLAECLKSFIGKKSSFK